MPTLSWPGKSASIPSAAALRPVLRMYPQGQGYPAAPQNRLLYGDNLAIMAALLPEYENRIDLIYLDPPFFTNRQWSARIGRGEDSRRPSTWQTTPGYSDNWASLDAYLSFLYPRLLLAHRLLAPHGTLYLHLDWHANAYARLLLDEIFGPERLLNEIIWVYHGPSPIRSAFNRKHDTLFAYTKSADYYFDADAVRVPYNENTIKTFKASPKAGFGKKPNLARGKVPEDWWYFPVVARLHRERTGYPTQKPLALLERIVAASCPPGGLVADFFCGSGTTLLAADRLGRRYIGADATLRALHVTQARLAVHGQTPLEISVPENERWPTSSAAAAQFGVRREGNIIRLEAPPPVLDYWEALTSDPIPASLAQSARPSRKKAPDTTLLIPEDGTITHLRLITSTDHIWEIPL